MNRAQPYLTAEQENALALRWRDQKDERALHDIINSHTRLARSMAFKFKSYGLMIDDLIQEGHVGLMEAAVRFDPDKGYRFSTYAQWWVRAAMQDYILRNWSVVRCGSSAAQKMLFFNLRRLRARLEMGSERLSGSTLHARIAAELRVPVNDVVNMDRRISAPDTSMEAPIGDDGSTSFVDTLISDDPLPDEIAEKTIDAEKGVAALRGAMKHLKDRERRIIKDRLLSEDPIPLHILGESLGISKERVRQIEVAALDKLKKALLPKRLAVAA